MHRKMVKSDLISGGHIRPGPDMAGYKNLAGFRPGPGPDMISGATLQLSDWPSLASHLQWWANHKLLEWLCKTNYNSRFLTCDAFVRMKRRAVATIFVRLSGTGVRCDHTVHISADLSLWLKSPMFWTRWHQSMSTYSQPSFSSSTWKRGQVWMCKLGVICHKRSNSEVKLLLSANRKSHMPRRLAQQRALRGMSKIKTGGFSQYGKV